MSVSFAPGSSGDILHRTHDPKNEAGTVALWRSKSVISKETAILRRTLDWMITDRAENLISIMSGNATFIQFPPRGSSTSLITVYGDHGVTIQRTIRSILQLACQYYVGSIWPMPIQFNALFPLANPNSATITAFLKQISIATGAKVVFKSICFEMHRDLEQEVRAAVNMIKDVDVIKMKYQSHNNKPLSNGFFSADIDEEYFYDDDIPFPLNGQSNVVLEKMCVKKAKTLAKARSGGTPIRQVHFPRAEPTVFGTQEGYCGLPGLPHPLPLQTLYPYTKRGPSRHRSITRRDSYGITHLGSADCELSIIFPHSAHFEVWDMGDNTIMGCPVILSIAAKDPEEWTGVSIAVPEVSLVEVKCEDTPFPSCVSKYDPSQEFSVTYTGSKTGTSTDDGTSISQNPKPKSRSNSTGTDGISIEGHWTRVYAKTDGSDEDDHTPRWNLQIWIPIRTRLLEKRETRAFNVNARIWLMGDERRALSLDGKVDGEVVPLLADAKMTVSDLRREREMVWKARLSSFA
ncbi:hypothetical protein D9613_004566 [Agrocybe pediades]|uniref:Mug60/KHD4 KH type I domain-containing protein n=1 Tax=Agrocybe pediades TaxID=84607 RepID=A0A8H4QKR6_9AGAR|nr:hypothetical protein D9613_004566 [Agrocybe pediades]